MLPGPRGSRHERAPTVPRSPSFTRSSLDPLQWVPDAVTVTPSWDPKTATYREGAGPEEPPPSWESLPPPVGGVTPQGGPSAGTAAPADLPPPDTVAAEGWVYVDPKSYSDPYAHAPVYTSGQQQAPPAPGAPGPAHPPSSLHGVPEMPTGFAYPPVPDLEPGVPGHIPSLDNGQPPEWPPGQAAGGFGATVGHPNGTHAPQAPDPTSAYPEPIPPTVYGTPPPPHPHVAAGPGSAALREGWVADPAYGSPAGPPAYSPVPQQPYAPPANYPQGAGGTAVAPAPGLVPIPAVTEGWSPSAPGTPPPPDRGLYQGVVPPVAPPPGPVTTDPDVVPQKGDLKFKERRSWKTWQLVVAVIVAAVVGMWFNGNTGSSSGSASSSGSSGYKVPPPAGSTATTAAGGSATATTAPASATSTTAAGSSSTSVPAAVGPATVLVPQTTMSGNWTSPSFNIAGGTWNIGWAFQCAPAPTGGPSFQIFVVNTGAPPGSAPVVTSTAATGNAITPQTSTGSQQVVVQTTAACRWAVKVTGSSS